MHTVFETEHWIVSHRRDSRYAGSLIVGAKSDSREVSTLSSEALAELGFVLAKTEALLISFFKPYRVITAKLGFSAGFSCHFHILPVSTALLDEIKAHPEYTDDPDGNDALLFTRREYGERLLTEQEQRMQLDVVLNLRDFLGHQNGK